MSLWQYIAGKALPEPAQAPEGSSAPTLAATPAKPTLEQAEAVAAGIGTTFEGFEGHPYKDPIGVWTIGYGSTRDVNECPVCATTPPISEPMARGLLAQDMGEALREVVRDVKVDLTLDQWAALGDFIYNLGAGNFRSSTLLKKLNAKDYAGAAAEIDKWDHAGGREMAGLLRRRQAETKLFTS